MGTKKFKFCIPEGTQVGTNDKPAKGEWTCFEVYDASADTLCEFLHGMTISEVDDEGTVLSSRSFHDAPVLVQSAVLRLTGITWQDVRDCEIPGEKPERKPTDSATADVQALATEF